MRLCDHCGQPISTEGLPPSIRMWCSTACHDKWVAERPEEQEGCIKVEDLSPGARAHLLARLGLAEVKA